MFDDKPSVAEVNTTDEEIVAYLDGELDSETAARVERRLSEDPAYRARLVQLQQAWDLLDDLGRTDADDEFVQSTVAMVAVQAEQEAMTQRLRVVRRRSFAGLAVAVVVVLSAVAAYTILQNRLPVVRENRNLVRDLPVIERVDEYRSIDSVEFLKQLERENLFAAEVDDGT